MCTPNKPILTPTPSLPFGVSLPKVQVLANLTQSGVFPIGHEKVIWNLSLNIVVCLLASGSGSRLNRSIETLLFV